MGADRPARSQLGNQELKSRVREGGRIKRQHHPPRTPLQRLLATGQVSKEKARALLELQQSSDPMALLETIRRHQAQLALLASGEQASNPGGTTTALADPDAENRSLESFLSGLQLLWKESQPRLQRAKPRTGKRTRIDPFEADAERMRQWLAEEPIVTPKELMERLIEKNPERYGMRHLRTMQRRVSGYRLAQIERELQETLEPRQGPEQPMGKAESPVLPGVKSFG